MKSMPTYPDPAMSYALAMAMESDELFTVCPECGGTLCKAAGMVDDDGWGIPTEGVTVHVLFECWDARCRAQWAVIRKSEYLCE